MSCYNCGERPNPTGFVCTIAWHKKPDRRVNANAQVPCDTAQHATCGKCGALGIPRGNNLLELTETTMGRVRLFDPSTDPMFR